MKVFEVVIITVDSRNRFAGIAQQSELISSLHVQEAKNEAIVNYAIKHKLSGRDLTGVRVCARESQLTQKKMSHCWAVRSVEAK